MSKYCISFDIDVLKIDRTAPVSISLPPDKSIAHRGLIVASASGSPDSPADSVIRSFHGEWGRDVLTTAKVLKELGIRISARKSADTEEFGWMVEGRGKKLASACNVIDCGNSGTTARLLTGVLAAQEFVSFITGDRSLRRRPMNRIIQPLSLMNASFVTDNNRLPLAVIAPGPQKIKGLEIDLDIPSAQVKSTLILAHVFSGTRGVISESAYTRDHTERILTAAGFPLVITKTSNSPYSPRTIDVQLSSEPLSGIDLIVPGDFSQVVWYAFLSGYTRQVFKFPAVGLNPSRTYLLVKLLEMGFKYRIDKPEFNQIEPRGDLVLIPPLTGESLRSIEIDSWEVPLLIDELPGLMLLSLLAGEDYGASRFRGLEELRIKESDRLSAMVELMNSVGNYATLSLDKELIIRTGRKNQSFNSDLNSSTIIFNCRRDHRLEMAAVCLAYWTGCEMILKNANFLDISDKNFKAQMSKFGLRFLKGSN